MPRSAGHGHRKQNERTQPRRARPAESILMAVAGRRGVIAELSGPGLLILASRIPAPAHDEA
jgi:hypothetical protein